MGDAVSIRRANVNDADQLAALIAASFRDVAEQFGLTRDTCPGHTSYLTAEEVRRGMGFGNQYFMAFCGIEACGAIAIRLPKGGTGIVEKVAVLPDYRHRGIGRQLMAHAIDTLQLYGAHTAAIGIIADHAVLRGWYEALGFRAGQQTHYAHLPFAVLHMQRTI